MIDKNALQQINYIIEHDHTSSTYKYVLLKGVIDASQKYDHLITFKNSKAIIPLGLIIEQWIFDYMPFVFKNIAQQHNRNVLDKPIIAIYYTIFEMLQLDSAVVSWEYAYMRFKEAYVNPVKYPAVADQFFKLSKKIANKIVAMPMRYTGRGEYDFFQPNIEKFGHIKLSKGIVFDSAFLVGCFGSFSINIQHYNVFRYLGQTLYGTSTIISKWKQKTNSLNGDQQVIQDIIDKLSADTLELRETSTIRELLPYHKECVWSGKDLVGDRYDVDHLLPYSVWFNNDLWNMLPTDRTINQHKKRDRIPTRELIEKRADVIFGYWNDYQEAMPNMFQSQINVALLPQELQSEKIFEIALESLCNKSDYLIHDRGYEPFAM